MYLFPSFYQFVPAKMDRLIVTGSQPENQCGRYEKQSQRNKRLIRGQLANGKQTQILTSERKRKAG